MKAVDLFGGYNSVLLETDVVCYAVIDAVTVIPTVLLEQLPVSDIEKLLKGHP